MADSESPLSSPPSTDDEAMELQLSKPTGLDRYFKPAAKSKNEHTPEPPRRAPSPPHEYTLADNDAIAFLVMFRSRFSDAFPKSLPHYGPQDIERGVTGDLPDEQVERYLCALLGLVLNRKKDVERGHYGRALEDAISTHQSQWPTAWKGTNPLHGGKNFNNMTALERLVLLKTLVLWSLNSSETVQAIIKESFKQTRRDDDKNQPRSVQPWFSDSYRRRYWLVEGQDDSFFRIFRENDGKTAKSNTWFSVAGSIDEVSALADKFSEEGTTNAKLNAEKLRSAIPRFEAGDEKRRRREYRVARKAAFARPEPGFSLYEGRTRGKRMKYTYSDGEEDSDSVSRRSTRNATPLENGPTITASGRQVKPRVGGVYGESMHYDQRRDLEQNLADSGVEDSEDMPTTAPSRRPVRAVSRKSNFAVRTREKYDAHGDGDSESDEAQSSGKEWSGNEDEPDVEESEGEFDEDVKEDFSDEGPGDDDGREDENTVESLVVRLSYRKKPEGLVESPGHGSSTNGLPVLLPKPSGHVSPSDGSQANGLDQRGRQQQMGDAIEVAMSNGGRAAPELVIGYGRLDGAMQAGHSPHAQPQVPMQTMDVS